MGCQKYTYHREFSIAPSLWSNRLTRQRIKNKRRRNWYRALTLLQGKLTNYSRYVQNPHDNDLALTGRHYWIEDERWTANYHSAGSMSRRDETNPVNWLAEHILPARAWSHDAFFIDQANCAPSSFFNQYSLLPSLWKAATNANIQPLFFVKKKLYKAMELSRNLCGFAGVKVWNPKWKDSQISTKIVGKGSVCVESVVSVKWWKIKMLCVK